jgi:hypothetical protein
MRIGTWNMAGRWQSGWLELLLDADCDVWLLTEVNERIELPGYDRHLGEARMRARCHWAGVYSRIPLTPLPDPHVASAAAEVDGVTYCSTVLPWRGSGGEPTWPGAGPRGEQHSGRMRFALDHLLDQLPSTNLVWGGDWNQALEGAEWAGSLEGRRHLQAAIDTLGLQVPTAHLPHRLDGHQSIDHIGVSRDHTVIDVEQRTAEGLSDHDCYVVELQPVG